VINLNKVIKIKALKFPDIPHYEWEGVLLQHTQEYVVVWCKPGRKLIHHSKNKVFTINNSSIEYFSLKEWYTAAMEIEEGRVVSTYCNVAIPSIFRDNQITFVDLDLDYIQESNKQWTVVDEEEFKVNSVKYGYSIELKREAKNALDRLMDKVK
jgi:uncharacterized protein